MNRAELAEEFFTVKDHIRGAVESSAPIPLSYYREYNHLVEVLQGEPDPEIREADQRDYLLSNKGQWKASPVCCAGMKEAEDG